MEFNCRNNCFSGTEYHILFCHRTIFLLPKCICNESLIGTVIVACMKSGIRTGIYSKLKLSSIRCIMVSDGVWIGTDGICNLE